MHTLTDIYTNRYSTLCNNTHIIAQQNANKETQHQCASAHSKDKNCHNNHWGEV